MAAPAGGRGRLGALAFYQFPLAMVCALVLTYGLALDIQLDVLTQRGRRWGGRRGARRVGGQGGALRARWRAAGALRPQQRHQLAVHGLRRHRRAQLAILPIGRVAGFGDMARSFIGSTAPFVLGFALAPRRVWTALCRGAALVPVISVIGSVFTEIAGLLPHVRQLRPLPGPAFGALPGRLLRDRHLRVHARVPARLPPPLAAARRREPRRLLATQARAPFIAVRCSCSSFSCCPGAHPPAEAKVDLVMGGMVPAVLLLGPALLYALQRFTGESENLSGRDIIWPYFLDAIEQRPCSASARAPAS
jgi:hypothetical protein